MLSRIAVAICESMAGVRGKRRLLSGGTGFLAISGIVLFALVFYHIGAAIVISSTIATVFMWEWMRGFCSYGWVSSCCFCDWFRSRSCVLLSWFVTVT